MSRLSRREFLVKSGASLAGAVIAGSLAEKILFGDSPALATAADVFPGALLDDLAGAVHDLEGAFPYASALYVSNGGVSINRDRNGKRVSEAGVPTQGVTLRVFDGASFHEAAIGGVSRDRLAGAVRRLKTDVKAAKAIHRIEPLPALSQSWTTTMVEPPSSVPLADRLARVEQEFDRVNWTDPRVRSVRVGTDVVETRRIFVDRTRRLSSARTIISHSAILFGFDHGKPGFGLARTHGQGGLELARLPDDAIEKLKQDMIESFGAEPMPPGEYEVVFAPPVSGLLAHESFGHGVEMDQFVKDRAKAREFLGKPVASQVVSLVDDPSYAGGRGSYPFDDEGMLAKPTTIIENGVFVQPLTDLMSATWLGTARTPNGRTQGWDRKVYARMSNTFIARGTSEVGAVMESLKDGMYLEGFRNGIEDPQGWGIQFTAATAREYKGGKPTGKLFSPVTVTGYVPEILSNVTLVGNDFALEAGTCGKGDKEFVPVTSGGPHLRTRARCS